MIFGDPKQVKVVRWIFNEFVNRLKSMNWIAAELNRKGIPARHGGMWYVATIRDLLRRREYCGDFSYNARKCGQFHIVNEKQEVVPISDYHDEKPKPWKSTEEGRIVEKGTHKPLIDPKVFDGAQKRLDGFSMKGSRKPRANGFPLSSGILVCDHCGRPMFGCQPTGRKYRVYRCNSPAKTGVGSCGMFEIREELILPAVLRMLGEEIKDLEKMLTAPPDELRSPNRKKEEDRAAVKAERDALAQKIEKYQERILDIDDKATRQDLDRKITGMRAELAKMDAELTDAKPSDDYNKEQLARLATWWDDFEKRAVRVPIHGKVHPAAAFFQDPFSEEQTMLLDARVVNEALHTLGCEVRLRWTTKRVTLKNGKQQNRYSFDKGRFRLGQRKAEISAKKGVKFYSSRLPTPDNGRAMVNDPVMIPGGLYRNRSGNMPLTRSSQPVGCGAGAAAGGCGSSGRPANAGGAAAPIETFSIRNRGQ